MAQELGIVKLVSGSVSATAADGSTRVLQTGDKVFDTDILATAAGSAIVIQLADGSTVDMGGNDRMQLGAVLQEQEREEAVVAQNPPPAGPSVEDIQAALLAGADPTQIADPTAAGAPAAGAAGGGVAGNEGHVPVSVDYLNPVAPVTNGFDTTGPSVAFNNIVPEVLLLNPDTLSGAQITGGNLPPVAANDSVSGIPVGTPVTLDVLGNDNDPDGSLNPASVTIVGSGGPGQPLVVAGQGTWSVNPATGAITFTPAAGFTGDPTPISYTVADNLGLVSNPATVTVDYNRPPVAANDSASGIAAGTPVTLDVLGNDNDPDGSLNPASVTIVGSGGPGQPLVVAGQGTWSVNPATGAITFTPAAGFTGDPTPISYTVADNLGLVSNPATVTVDYNRPPVAGNDSASGIAAGTPVTLDVLGNDNDPDGSLNPASVTIVGSGGPGQPLVVAGQGTWSVNPATGAITFTPAAGFTGDPTPISYTVADNLGLVSNPATVTVDYNRPPVAGNDSASGIAAGTPVTLDVLGNDNDPDGSLNPASVTIVGSGGPGQPLVVAGQGTWTVNPATGAITFTPDAGFTGDPTPISYTVADNLGLVSNPATVTVDYNRPPVAGNDSASGIAAGTPVTLDVLGNDNDPDGSLNPASVTIVGSGGPGQPLVVAGQGTWSVNPATGAITFTPAAGFTGDPTPISYTVADNLGLVSNPATVTVDYNRPPVAGNDSASGIAAGTPVTLDVLGNDNDPDGSLNPASVTIVGSGGPGQPLVVAGQGTWSVNPATGAITFTPAAGFTGDPTPISYTVADNLGLVSNPATVTVDYIPTVVATNAVVDETNGNLDQTGGAVLVEPTGSGSLLIDGQPPVSVTLAAAGATWDAASKTLDTSTYRITVNADGSYEFALKGALSHPGAADAASAPIQYDISAVLTGTNGEVANAVFRVDVYDDGPRVANSNGQVQNVAQPDQVLSGLIDYDLGFDGFGASGGVTLVNNNGALTSRGDSISYLVFDSNGDNLQEIYAFVDKGGLTTEANYLDQKSIDRAVFSLEPTEPGSVDGAYKLVLYDVLDIPAPTSTTLTFENATSVSASQIAFGSSLVVQGSNLVLSPANHIGVNDNALDRGETLTFKFGGVVNAVQMNDINADLAGPDRFSWTAYKDGAIVGSRNNVTMPSGGFTPAINVNGGFDALKIDITAGKFELGGLKYQAASSQTLQLNFGFTATDGDGDSVSGSFSVNAGKLLTTGVTTTLPELQHADSHVH
ncbi:retention module-containing protein [Methylomonas sp. EFPC3]|uniref:retention module-containing protein n=1 Tax=Methylomonas sp. EFPC3 TaxID=3021710 RepID=UPI002416D6B6|nr:retention module-containing protein [Methylomonas sp. EFPC3]WFP49720.1 retention module-containing protein [Methylomonas sp. EFPC3]